MGTDGPPWEGSSRGKPSLEEAFDRAFENVPPDLKDSRDGFVATITVSTWRRLPASHVSTSRS